MTDDLTPVERRYIAKVLRLEANKVHNLSRWHLEHERGDRKQAVRMQAKFDRIHAMIKKLEPRP